MIPAIKAGSDESHFNVKSFIVSEGQVSTNHNLFEKKGWAEAESSRGRCVFQPIALPLGQTGSRRESVTSQKPNRSVFDVQLTDQEKVVGVGGDYKNVV